MSQSCPNHSCQGKKSALPWIALAAAVGLSAAAFAVALKHRGASASAGGDPEDLLDLCEQAASQLDARVARDDVRFAV